MFSNETKLGGAIGEEVMGTPGGEGRKDVGWRESERGGEFIRANQT